MIDVQAGNSATEIAKAFFKESPIEKVDKDLHEIGGTEHHAKLSPLRDFLHLLNEEVHR